MTDVDLSDVPPLLRTQVRRRIAAIEEYLAPTKRDPSNARSLARRVGMTTARFERLARSWERHRRALLLADTRYRPPPIHPEVARILEAILKQGTRLHYDEIMTTLVERAKRRSVPPARYRAAIRRLASASRKYASPQDRNGATAAEFAEQVGIAEDTFRRLASTWAERHGLPTRPSSSPPPPRMPEPIERAVDEIAAQDAADLELGEIMRRLAVRCAALGLRTPSAIKVSRRLASRKTPPHAPGRGEPTEGERPEVRPQIHAGPSMIAIQHRRARHAIRDTLGGVIVPTVTLAILMPERLVVGHFVSATTNRIQATAHVLLKGLAMAAAGAPIRPVTFPKDQESDWSQIDLALARVGVVTAPADIAPINLDSALETILYPAATGYLPLGPSRAAQSAPTVLSEAKAIKLIREAVEAHNRARGWDVAAEEPQFALSPKAHLSSLRSELVSLARRPLDPTIDMGAERLTEEKTPPAASPTEPQWPFPSQN